MAIPEHAHPSMHEHFKRGYVGESSGEDGTAYITRWDSRCGVKPTPTLGNAHFCIYCGNKAYPLQPAIQYNRDVSYDVIGYACVCADAVAWRDWKKSMEELEDRHSEERRLLMQQRPSMNMDVVQSVTINSITSRLSPDSSYERVKDVLDRFGIRLND